MQRSKTNTRQEKEQKQDKKDCKRFQKISIKRDAVPVTSTEIIVLLYEIN